MHKISAFAITAAAMTGCRSLNDDTTLDGFNYKDDLDLYSSSSPVVNFNDSTPSFTLTTRALVALLINELVIEPFWGFKEVAFRNPTPPDCLGLRGRAL